MIESDVRTIAVQTLKKNVGALLAAPAFDRTLRAQRIELSDFSAPQQTQTTQRWKLQMRLDGTAQNVPTKIEFSRRQFHADLAFEDASRCNRERDGHRL